MTDTPRPTYVRCRKCGQLAALAEGVHLTRCDACGAVVSRRERGKREGVRPVSLATASPEFRKFLEGLPEFSPRDLDAQLEALGYRGQETARRAACLGAYRHVRRLKRLFLEGAERRLVPAKSNMLLMGPTGSGKTHLAHLLFREVLKLPTVLVDITGFSETGYVGEDTRSILTRLVHAAGGRPELAACGVVVLDEFDKLASGQNRARFAGEGTTKDVSGFGVQRELLSMLESGEMPVPMDFAGTSYSPRTRLDTGDILFIACGAFSGFAEVHHRRRAGDRLGLRNKPESRYREGIAFLLEEEDVVDLDSFATFGFLPELIARFSRVVPFQPLDAATLRRILQDNVLRRYVEEFAAEGLELHLDEGVLDAVVAESLRRQTGARGLESVLTRALEDVAFDTFRRGAVGQVHVTVEEGRLRARHRRRA